MTAAGALLALSILAAAAVLAHRRRPTERGAPGLSVEARALLGRDSGLALVRADGQALLVGWGTGGVRLVARLGREHRT